MSSSCEDSSQTSLVKEPENLKKFQREKEFIEESKRKIREEQERFEEKKKELLDNTDSNPSFFALSKDDSFQSDLLSGSESESYDLEQKIQRLQEDILERLNDNE
ncbi:hypothetical protein D3C80_1971050 [compost metagenome]